MSDQENNTIQHIDDNGVTTSHKKEDGSLHVEHNGIDSKDDFIIKMVKSGAYKTMTNN
ncbi:hypothetical protein PY093_02120 [Cytobacillus sp. S13-E01]|uniref:hypothetical protein n=1 Tax=Cytobacillus sp. S13-E01 TaxID=3031326 RepID=UPI0023D7DBCF|nr:hypothetical protein [Cytobacillus sp. S13-E01]MDF0725507.1 hypothetical protein [Cytobacillus sp. S13-E01]